MSSAVDSPKTYFLVFGNLMALTALTVGAAYIHFGHHAINVTVALAIATLKAVLVVWFFMHVRHLDGLSRVFVIVGLLWVGIMFIHTLSDYLTRPWDKITPQTESWVKENARQIVVRDTPRFQPH